MKGLSVSVEEKAQRYDEALEKARQLCDYPTTQPFISDLQDLFPELRESEDERIRTKLLNLLKELLELGGVAQDTWSINDCEQFIAWLEKQQKPADKVEPKFQVGDWFVKNDGSHINKDYNTCKISNIGNGYYAIESIYGYTGKIAFETFDTNYHLWTIQDAKDGDVLADGDLPFIFKKIELMMHSYAYCGISVDDGFKIESEGESGEWTWMQDIKPATKEQRDTLLKAMTGAGYTFDFEKKKLKKIEQKSAEWSEENDKLAKNLISTLSNLYARNLIEKETKEKYTNLLKSLKYRVFPQPKQEWGEEDKKMIGNIRRIIEQYALSKSAVDVNGELCEKEFIDADNWLKSLRPQSHWKPSDEQMEALEKECIAHSNYELCRLLEQLKKLREK